ncbi:MAG: type II CAAX endopeptidase family protein [Deltaproteobacteria bacterium]|nr:type II CAAX endopeptidase family protein [Deltaproteobacteria bacterium]
MLSTSQKWPKDWMVLGFFVVLVLFQIPTAIIIRDISIPLGVLLNEYVLLMGGSLLVALRWGNFSNLFPFQKREKKTFFWAILMTLALVVIIDGIAFWSEKIFPLPPEIKAMLKKLMTVHSWQEGVWRWFLLCITPALCEEIFFRGLFQNTLAHRWNRKSALIMTAVAFAAIHGIPQYFHLYLLLGFYLGWLMLESRSLFFPILAHFINNSWTFINFCLGNETVVGDNWHGTDTLMIALALFVFFVSAFRFRESCRKIQNS